AVALAGRDAQASRSAISAVCFYLGTYVFMNLAAFAIVALLRNSLRSEEIASYAGLIRTNPGLVVATGIVLVSLIGLPPLAGFISKFLVFSSIVQAITLSAERPMMLVLLVVGGINNGWAVAMGLLGFERGEAAATAPIRFQAELDRLLLLAKQRGVASDPRIRQRLAWCYSKVQVMRFIGMRTLTQFLKGHHPGPDGAIFKLYWSEYHKVVTELGIDILGLDALVPTGRKPSSAFQTDDAGAPNDSMSWAMTFLNARAGTIYAGSSQIQKNIIGEMVLGLPKEPKPN
ncbi:MAG: hypothetical protein EBZ54_04860, partial [Actinobacteria bacterium]|nr:hypothetical protein [Actinomycetota bacterium]